MTPNLNSENGEKFSVEDKEIISITNGHDYANVNIIGKSAVQHQITTKYHGDHFHDDSDHLVLKVDTSSENGLCISMVGGKPESEQRGKIENSRKTQENTVGSFSPQKVIHSKMKSPIKSKARPMIPVRTVSLPGEADVQNVQVMSTFKPKESKALNDNLNSARVQSQNTRLGKVSAVRDKV